MPWELMDHTADIGIKVRSENVSRAFKETAEAVFNLMVEGDKKGGRERSLHLSTDSLDMLLVDFLSELLFLFETEGFVVVAADVEVKRRNGGWALSSSLDGEVFDPEKHSVNFEIKAVTYHMLEVGEDGRVQVLFDI